ncbi:threonine dehydratase [Mariprofundus ferrinatatus]|uniref:L-serine dehydratase n=1 Tax=Mariprofundus ferrinatatus TaxID=1921087 RepID=A0A2K8L872_9PROT|nr:threonine ammonia-lyase [Mariprofundus ferrinatatus]ATX82449.1 threonine dehydratase [Mariprofundus ferrinatatus]
MTISIADIREAAELIQGVTVDTPCTRSRLLSKRCAADIVLKFENHQFTASFKDRGALVKLLSLSESEKQQGVIAMSAGNHAQAVAYHASRLGIPATIVMPAHTPHLKVKNTRAFGADVILFGDGLKEARQRAEEMAAESGLTMIHPYDDLKIMAGQGTVAVEMLESFPDLEMLVVPIGGGGLISGVAVAAKAINPEIRIIGVQTERFPAMKQALAGNPVECGSRTIAEGIAVKTPGRHTLPIVRELVDEILLVDEDLIEAAVEMLLEVEKSVVEGAGAAGLAAVLAHKNRFQGRRVGLILSGGNIDMFTLSSVIQRGLVRSGSLVRISVDIPDEPDALARITALFGRENANIVQVYHQRDFTHLSIRQVRAEFLLQVLGRAHLDELLELLVAEGYEATVHGSE